MKQFARWMMLPAILASSPAAAQQAREYKCNDTMHGNVEDHYWFGAGFFEIAEDREDNLNRCAVSGSNCQFDGTSFSGTGATWAFTYNGSTGAYTLRFTDDGYQEAGTCAPV
jgi:hypothetical protein